MVKLCKGVRGARMFRIARSGRLTTCQLIGGTIERQTSFLAGKTKWKVES
jgi:hypothetical protein